MSRKEWKTIGKYANWIKKAMPIKKFGDDMVRLLKEDNMIWIDFSADLGFVPKTQSTLVLTLPRIIILDSNKLLAYPTPVSPDVKPEDLKMYYVIRTPKAKTKENPLPTATLLSIDPEDIVPIEISADDYKLALSYFNRNHKIEYIKTIKKWIEQYNKTIKALNRLEGEPGAKVNFSQLPLVLTKVLKTLEGRKDNLAKQIGSIKAGSEKSQVQYQNILNALDPIYRGFDEHLQHGGETGNVWTDTLFARYGTNVDDLTKLLEFLTGLRNTGTTEGFIEIEGENRQIGIPNDVSLDDVIKQTGLELDRKTKDDAKALQNPLTNYDEANEGETPPLNLIDESFIPSDDNIRTPSPKSIGYRHRRNIKGQDSAKVISLEKRLDVLQGICDVFNGLFQLIQNIKTLSIEGMNSNPALMESINATFGILEKYIKKNSVSPVTKQKKIDQRFTMENLSLTVRLEWCRRFLGRVLESYKKAMRPEAPEALNADNGQP